MLKLYFAAGFLATAALFAGNVYHVLMNVVASLAGVAG